MYFPEKIELFFKWFTAAASLSEDRSVESGVLASDFDLRTTDHFLEICLRREPGWGGFEFVVSSRDFLRPTSVKGSIVAVIDGITRHKINNFQSGRTHFCKVGGSDVLQGVSKERNLVVCFIFSTRKFFSKIP